VQFRVLHVHKTLGLLVVEIGVAELVGLEIALPDRGFDDLAECVVLEPDLLASHALGADDGAPIGGHYGNAHLLPCGDA
jgi:hypothetical protein